MNTCFRCGKPLSRGTKTRTENYKSQCRPCFLINPPTGELNGNWHGGKYPDKRGYIYVAISGLKDKKLREMCKQSVLNRAYGKQRSGLIYEHHVSMIKSINRPLEKGEIVHHMDGNPANNHISNLILLSQKDHVWDYRNLMFENKRLKELLTSHGITF